MYVYLDNNTLGLVYLDLDDQWIEGLSSELSRYGYIQPPYFYPPTPVGAHITLLPAKVEI